MPRNYNYAYQNIKRQLSEIQKTLGYVIKEENIKDDLVLRIQQYTLDENMTSNSTAKLKVLNLLFQEVQQYSPPELQEIGIFQILKLQIERLRAPDLESFIKDIEQDPPVVEERTDDSSSDIFYREAYSEGDGRILKPYKLIDGTMHPCRIDENGHVTLLGVDATES